MGSRWPTDQTAAPVAASEAEPGSRGTPIRRTAVELTAMLIATAAMMAVKSVWSMAAAAPAAEASTKLNSPI